MQRSGDLEDPRSRVAAQGQTHDERRHDEVAVDDIGTEPVHQLPQGPDTRRTTAQREVDVVCRDPGLAVQRFARTAAGQGHMYLDALRDQFAHQPQGPHGPDGRLHQMQYNHNISYQCLVFIATACRKPSRSRCRRGAA